MACKDSDYTVVITIMHCPYHTILVLKLTLVVEIQKALLSCCQPPLLERSLQLSLPVQLSRITHKDSDHTVCCRSLTLTCQNSPCWRSCERCNNFLSSLWPPLLAIDWVWLPRGMCVNGNELQYLACATASRNQGCNGYQECGCPS